MIKKASHIVVINSTSFIDEKPPYIIRIDFKLFRISRRTCKTNNVSMHRYLLDLMSQSDLSFDKIFFEEVINIQKYKKTFKTIMIPDR